jgi:glycerol-1-phosphate dehydrogenase [NAD(P)+]
MHHEVTARQALESARDTRCLEIGHQLLAEVPRIFREQFGDRSAVIVADRNTVAVAGGAVAAALKAAGIPARSPYVFEDPELYAEYGFMEALENALQTHDAVPIACGSGTINDLVKLAAHRLGRQYLCVATAASMDGYAAFGASITWEGSKQTFLCPAPKAVVADLGVISAAPAEMGAWGYADLMAKIPAGADWILADALGVEPINQNAWKIVQGRLSDMLADPTGVRAGSPAAVGRLIEGLMLSGFAMQTSESSRPASGAEHQFSHLWDMQHHTHRGRAPSHGFKVGIATLAVTALYEELLRQPIERLDVDRCCMAWPERDAYLAQARELLAQEDLRRVAEQEMSAKYCDRGQLREQLRRLREVWPELRERLQRQLVPLVKLQEMLVTVGAPIQPEEIGISRERLRASYWQAYCIRRRFTVLDLAVRTDLLDACLAAIFGPLGPWPTSAEGERSRNRAA